MDFQARLEALAKNKKIVIPAVLIGGAAGIYVLATKGQGGGAANVVPGASDQPNPSQDSGGGSGGDTAGLLQQLAEQQQQNQSMFSQLQDSFQRGLQSLSDALGQSNAANQSALQSLADQTNKALAGVQTSGFNGFDSQFGALLSQLPQSLQQANTGVIQQSMSPSIASFTGGSARDAAQKINMALASIGARVNSAQVAGVRSSRPVLSFNHQTFLAPFVPAGLTRNPFSGAKATITNYNPFVGARASISNPIIRPSTQPITQRVIGTTNAQYGRGH